MRVRLADKDELVFKPERNGTGEWRCRSPSRKWARGVGLGSFVLQVSERPASSIAAAAAANLALNSPTAKVRLRGSVKRKRGEQPRMVPALGLVKMPSAKCQRTTGRNSRRRAFIAVSPRFSVPRTKSGGVNAIHWFNERSE